MDLCELTMYNRGISNQFRENMWRCYLLVLPAASNPSISKRISLEPKSLPMIFETEPPILIPSCGDRGSWYRKGFQGVSFGVSKVRIESDATALYALPTFSSS